MRIANSEHSENSAEIERKEAAAKKIRKKTERGM